MERLGSLLWWHVDKGVAVKYGLAEQMASDLGVRTPPPPAPIDVFRRVVNVRLEFVEDDQDCALTLVHDARRAKVLPAKMVKSVFDEEGVLASRTPVGEATFQKATRRRGSKAQFKVTHIGDERTTEYAHLLRKEYQEWLAMLNDQGLRRMVRMYLTQAKALYLGAPYFVPSTEFVDRLDAWFTKMGPGTRLSHITVYDTPDLRALLSRAIDTAVANHASETVDLVEAYVPLGVVPESIWQKLGAP
jgi:hypothetical protein